VAEPRKRSFRALPSLLISAARLVWAASRAQSAITLGLLTFASLALFGQIVLIHYLLDAILEVGRSDGALGDALVPVVLFAVLTAAMGVASSVGYLQQRVLTELVGRSVWRQVLDVSQAVELSAYDDPDFYDQAERVQTQAARRAEAVATAFTYFVGDALGVVATTLGVLTVAPILTPILLLSGVPLMLTSRAAGRLEFAFAVEHTAENRERNYLQSLLAQRDEAKEVRAYSLSTALRRRWENNYATHLGQLRRHVKRRVVLAAIGSASSGVLTGAALLLALFLVASGDLAIASAGAAVIAVRLLGSRVSGSSRWLSMIFESSFFLRDLTGFSARKPAQPQDGEARAAAPAQFNRLSVSDVTFTYPGAARPSLRGVSVELRRNEVIAVVGENGSGKSTLAKLLANLYEPDEGAIYWDGVDVRKYDTDSVRSRIAVIFQDFIRYRFTAHANIALGRPDEDADEAAVRAAARDADADGFLSALAAGYDTVLSKEYEGGTDLSLGQWQRVALARAFIRDAPFIVLDEPSAALDARAEDELFQRIRTLFTGRTVLLISHRFSTVRMADRIYVMSQGRVIEEGDHASLIRQAGVYAELFKLQASGYVDLEDE
jgi:ATP-binding cassette subfamily B protein